MIYWTMFQFEQWQFTIAATEQGLCFTGADGEGIGEIEAWAKKKMPKKSLQENAQFLAPYIQQFEQFFKDQRKQLDFPLHYNGTIFQQQVWHALQQIPFGELRTYSEIAQQIGKPKAVRAVASAIGANPVMVVIPCHRVIGKDGSLTGFRGGLKMKERLLNFEEKM